MGVGIGPGSVCTTRKKTGVGYPQLSAVLECADNAHGLSAHIISEGGCTNPGDIATAMQKHKGGVAEYRASEGKTVEVPYRGDVHDTMRDILGGLRSACTYVGAGRVKEMPKRTTFIRVTQQLNNIFS